jgi:hypothetical protein
MYIQIKHIKKFFLISACIFFAGFNYLTYVKADSTKNNEPKGCDKTTDADCDGLINAEEKLYKTDANNSDSDGDSYSDGVEVKSGYDPTIPAPGDRVKNNIASNAAPSQATNGSITTGFVQELQSYSNTQGDQPITSADLQSFMTSSIDNKLGEPMTWSSLSAMVDTSQIKILKQDYASLDEANRQNKILRDEYKYLTVIQYVLKSNMPTQMNENADLDLFIKTFQEQLLSLSNSNPDMAYFSDLGNRLELFSQQIANIDVPETILPLHIKFLALIKGALSLRETPSIAQDPLATVIVFSKIQNLIDLSSDFFQNDFQNHFKQF